MPQMMKMGDLHRAIGCAYSIAQLRRWAVAGQIPATYKMPGKHFRFKRCARLSSWIQRKACRVDAEKRSAEAAILFRTKSPKEWRQLAIRGLAQRAQAFVSKDTRYLTPEEARELLASSKPLGVLLSQLAQKANNV